MTYSHFIEGETEADKIFPRLHREVAAKGRWTKKVTLPPTPVLMPQTQLQERFLVPQVESNFWSQEQHSPSAHCCTLPWHAAPLDNSPGRRPVFTARWPCTASICFASSCRLAALILTLLFACGAKTGNCPERKHCDKRSWMPWTSNFRAVQATFHLLQRGPEGAQRLAGGHCCTPCNRTGRNHRLLLLESLLQEPF